MHGTPARNLLQGREGGVRPLLLAQDLRRSLRRTQQGAGEEAGDGGGVRGAPLQRHEGLLPVQGDRDAAGEPGGRVRVGGERRGPVQDAAAAHRGHEHDPRCDPAKVPEGEDTGDMRNGSVFLNVFF